MVEGQIELGGEGADRREVGVGFCAAEAVVEVGYAQDQAKLAPGLAVCLVEGAQEGNGVRTAGDADGKAQARLEQRRVEGERMVGWRAHFENDTARGLDGV